MSRPRLSAGLWVNDSAATTPAATLSALAAFPERPAVVILGGVSKNADFSALARALVERARAAVLIGRAAGEIAQALASAGELPIRHTASLEDAVAAARELAQPGDVVLLSPACASTDMFSSADERGDRFSGLVKAFVTPVKQ